MSSVSSFEPKRSLNMSQSSENIQTPLSGAERFAEVTHMRQKNGILHPIFDSGRIIH